MFDRKVLSEIISHLKLCNSNFLLNLFPPLSKIINNATIKTMKKLIVISISILFGNALLAQKMHEKDVPASIMAAFKKQYPDVSKIKWEKEDGNFEAEFDLNRTETSALFDANGKMLESEVEIETKQLPTDVVEFIKNHYKGQKIKEAAKITDANGLVTYEAEMMGKDLIFDANGKFVKEVKD